MFSRSGKRHALRKLDLSHCGMKDVGAGCVAVMMMAGDKLEKDDAEAVRLYRLAAEQGHVVAQNNFGDMFYNGQGVAKDDTEAIRWYRLAAAQGNTRATAALKRLGA